MMRRIILVAGAIVGFATSAAALPIVSVDTDPGAAGVDASRIVAPGSTFFVDIVVSGVEAASPLNAFEFDLFFDPSAVTAVSTCLSPQGTLLAPAPESPPDGTSCEIEAPLLRYIVQRYGVGKSHRGIRHQL